MVMNSIPSRRLWPWIAFSVFDHKCYIIEPHSMDSHWAVGFHHVYIAILPWAHSNSPFELHTALVCLATWSWCYLVIIDVRVKGHSFCALHQCRSMSCSSSMSLNVLLSPFKLIRVVMADFGLVLGCRDIQMDRWACCWCLFSGVGVFVVGVAYILQVVDTSTLLRHLCGFFYLISLTWW